MTRPCLKTLLCNSAMEIRFGLESSSPASAPAGKAIAEKQNNMSQNFRNLSKKPFSGIADFTSWMEQCKSRSETKRLNSQFELAPVQNRWFLLLPVNIYQSQS